MKNIFKYVLVLLAVVLVLASCSDDFFTEVPSGKTTPDKNMKSKTEALYASGAPLTLMRNVVPQLVFSTDLMSDMTVVNDKASQNWKDIFNHSLSDNNPFLDPSGLYKIIINANESLKYIDTIRALDQDVTDIDLLIYKGSLVGARSWAYFTIARLYGEAAYIPDNLPSMPVNLEYIPRVAMYDTLINHLMPYLDIDYYDIGNIAMYNKALLGEIFLEKQDYANAKIYLRKAIEGFENGAQIFKVTNTYSKDSWKNIFIGAMNQVNEVMVAVPFTYRSYQFNPIEFWYGYKDDYVAAPSNYIVDLFNTQINLTNKPGDLSRGIKVSIDTLEGKYFVNKFNLSSGQRFESDIPLYRAADIHLLFAEALNRTDSSDIALAIMNKGYTKFKGWASCFGVRQRANLKPVVVPTDANLVEYVEDAIIQERAMELAFEGKRWTDLMRVARRRGTSYLADKVAAKYSDPSTAEAVRNKLNNEANWYLPFKK